MAGAALLFYFSVGEAPPRLDRRPQMALGQALAEEAIKLLGNGGRVTLIARDTSTVKNPASDWQVKAFSDTLRRAKLAVTATNFVQLDPLRVVRVPPGEFFAAIKKNSEADVVASLLGPPMLNNDDIGRLGERRPHIVAVCSSSMLGQMNLKELFGQNLLHLAIINRPRPAPELPASDNLHDWFDHFYQVVTPANLSELQSLTNRVTR